MAKRYASLRSIEHDRKLTKETDYEFLYHLQSALLLALKERGRLNEPQCRHALERLEQQRVDWIKKRREKG